MPDFSGTVVTHKRANVDAIAAALLKEEQNLTSQKDDLKKKLEQLWSSGWTGGVAEQSKDHFNKLESAIQDLLDTQHRLSNEVTNTGDAMDEVNRRNAQLF